MVGGFADVPDLRHPGTETKAQGTIEPSKWLQVALGHLILLLHSFQSSLGWRAVLCGGEAWVWEAVGLSSSPGLPSCHCEALGKTLAHPDPLFPLLSSWGNSYSVHLKWNREH